MNIGLTYDLRQDYLDAGYSHEQTAEFDRPDTVEGIEDALRALGHGTQRIGNIKSLVRRLAAGERWDMVFNICEGMFGLGREAQVPALLDAYEIPYTFSGPLILALALDKGLTKRVVRSFGVPTPDFAVVASPADIAAVDLPFPLFAKPLAEGTGKGIDSRSKIDSREQLASVCRGLLEKFAQPVLVETYLPGREFTVGIVGSAGEAEAIGVMEVMLNAQAEANAYSYVNKEQYEGKVDYALAPEREAGDCARGGAARLARPRLPRRRPRRRQDGPRRRREFHRGQPARRLEPHALRPADHVPPPRHPLPGADRSHHGLRRPEDRPMKLKKAVILHNQVNADSPKDELDVLVQADEVFKSLSELGYQPVTVPFSLDFAKNIRAIKKINPLFVFNLVESLEGNGQLIHLAPSLLDHLGLPYTGNDQEATFVTSNKILSKKLLQLAGVATPPWLGAGHARGSAGLGAGTYLLKSVWEHASNWFADDSIVQVADEAELRRLLEKKNRSGRGPVGAGRRGPFFAERYIGGREFNQAILTGESLPLSEIKFVEFPDDKLRILDFRAKWEENSYEYTHTPRSFEFGDADRPLQAELRAVARRCWEFFNLSGYARVDFRVDDENRPWVLEINTNPCLSPDGGFYAAAERAGLSFTGMVERIVNDCLSG